MSGIIKRPIDPRRIEIIDEQMAEVYRRKSPAERLAIAHGMWRMAHARVEAAVRWDHPAWTIEQQKAEIARRLLGGSDRPVEFPAQRR